MHVFRSTVNLIRIVFFLAVRNAHPFLIDSYQDLKKEEKGEEKKEEEKRDRNR